MGYTVWPDGATGEALRAINEERRRQDELKAKGVFRFTCADDGLEPTEKLAVLMEEVGEVANAVLQLEGLNTRGDRAREVRKELIQAAAVCVAWIESIREDGVSFKTMDDGPLKCKCGNYLLERSGGIGLVDKGVYHSQQSCHPHCDGDHPEPPCESPQCWCKDETIK